MFLLTKNLTYAILQIGFKKKNAAQPSPILLSCFQEFFFLVKGSPKKYINLVVDFRFLVRQVGQEFSYIEH